MPVDLETQLRDLGAVMLRESTPITVTDVQARTASGDGAPRDPTDLDPERRRDRRRGRRRDVALVAAAVMLLVAGGVWAIASRAADDADHATNPTLPAPGDLSVPGALTIADAESDWTLERASDTMRSLGTQRGLVTRRYGLDSPNPETGPALDVQIIDVDAGMPGGIEGDPDLTVNGEEAWWTESHFAGKQLAFQIGGYWFTVTGYGIADGQIVTAAEHTQLVSADAGAVVVAAGLPSGLVELATGFPTDMWLFPSTVDGDAIVVSYRGRAADASVWAVSVSAGPEVARLQRIGATTVTDVTVHGQPGFVTTYSYQPGLVGLVWFESERVFLLGGNGVAINELVDFAESLRPASADEWAAMLAASQPDPSSVIPAGVSLFPVIDESLVPDDGAGATFASYSYYGMTPDDVVWVGAVGRIVDGVPADLVHVSVGAVEEPPAEPGQVAGVTENVHGDGRAIRTTVNGATVELAGADTDLLYELLPMIRPEVEDGVVTGFGADGELPGSLIVVAGPTMRSASSGSFPSVSVHNGALSMDVQPTPVFELLASGVQAFETVDVGGRTGYLQSRELSEQGGGWYHALMIGVDDGTTLSLNTSTLTRAQFLAVAAAVQFVDEDTWIERYDPTPALRDDPGTVGAATTVAIVDDARPV